MHVTATTQGPIDTSADTVALAVFEGKNIPHDVPDGVLQALVDSGEAKASFKHLAHVHAEGKRWVLVGLGKRDELTPERARTAAAVVHARATELGTKLLCWELPHKLDDREAAAFVEGTLLASYAYKVDPDASPAIGELLVSDHADRSDAAGRALTIAGAQNRARRWQDLPSNDLLPERLAALARDQLQGLDVEVEGRDGLLARGMGAFAAVAQGATTEPALITARYDGVADGPVLALVGKAVTHDTGGYSIKPKAGMERMKFDMTGGAAVLQALAAIRDLALPVRVVAVVGAVENVIGPAAMKPGDVVRAMDGTSIEITNTDAEGRLVLCDCLTYARELGADRLVDIATLTGGVVTALGSVYAGYFANDDGLAQQVEAAGVASGERVWRLPLDPEYADLMKGRFADLVNSAESPKAHPVQGAEFLHRFVGDTPWAHIDIAGVAWDTGRTWGPKGGSGFGVRLLTELAAGAA